MLVSNEGLRHEIKAWASSMGLDVDVLADVAYHSPRDPNACGNPARSCAMVDMQGCAGTATGAQCKKHTPYSPGSMQGPSKAAARPGGACDLHCLLHVCCGILQYASRLQINLQFQTWTVSPGTFLFSSAVLQAVDVPHFALRAPLPARRSLCL